ncbi:MAG: ribonuclease T2 family protein [Beijerinckiaceae bacterium]
MSIALTSPLRKICATLAALIMLAAPVQAQRGGAAGEFDFYVLALSWSSGFCEIEGDRKQRDQCAAGAKLGFVVHGLWPQNERGFPSDCGPQGRSPSRAAMDIARDIFPSEPLARHEWRKHGTCSGSSPTDYFRDVKTAREKITIPQEFQKPEKASSWNPIDIERAFTAANPGLRADMIAISCRQNVLNEIRICLSKDLRSFRTCEEVDRGGCRGREIAVPPVR